LRDNLYMELRHLRYFCAVAEYGTFREAGRHLHVSQSAISEQVADLEDEIGGPLLERGQRTTRLTAQGQVFLTEAKKTLLAAERTIDLTRRSLQGQEGTLAIGFFVWGAGGFFPRIIREFRKRHPQVKLSLFEMHTNVQMEAFDSGKIDVGFTRPLEPPYDKALHSELLYNDPIVVVLPREHPLAKGPITIESLAGERWVMCERPVTPLLFDGIIALCTAAGFSPNIVNSSSTWSGIMTLVEAGEGISLVPSGARYIRPPGLVFCELQPRTTHVGLAVAWNPLNEGAVVKAFLRLVRENKEKIRRSAGN
jgi:DNA-binding transcriptional LysR family regulator